MKRSAIFFSLVLLLLTASATAFAQQSCDFSIVGTWKPASKDEANTILYRFAPDGTITALAPYGSGQSAELREIATATYKLDSPIAPKVVSLTAPKGDGIFTEGATLLEIIKHDDASFTSVKPGSEPTRWIRVDPNRYFLVLVARTGVFYDQSGPAFPILIKRAGGETQVDALGTYSNKGKRAFGLVPPEAYNEFMKETRSNSDGFLRLEITSAQYERGLKIVRTWERRVREGKQLYGPRPYLNNILVVKAVTESLNQCGDKIKMYKLNYEFADDWISDKFGSPFIPFEYFKELRRLNESLHVSDDAFAKLW